MSDRAQTDTVWRLLWFPPFAAVVWVVGKPVLDTQRQALAECAPGCDLGAPLFAHVGLVDAAIAAGLLLVALVPLVIHHRLRPPEEADE